MREPRRVDGEHSLPPHPVNGSREELVSRRGAIAVIAGALATAASPRLRNRLSDRRVVHRTGPRPPYGAALEYAPMRNEPDYRALFLKVARRAAVSGPLFWRFSEPAPGQFDFVQAAELIGFTSAHALPVHAHNLVWHQELPTWAEALTSARDAHEAIERHATGLVSHFAGTIAHWNVVNEPLEPVGGHDLRVTTWSRLLGEEYIHFAFRAANAADPAASLGINEFDVENDGRYAERKRDALLGLVRRLLAAKVPLHHVGLQSHLNAGDSYSASGLGSLLRGLTALGVRVCVTELDVDDSKISGDDDARDRAVADTYARFLDVVLAHAEPTEVVTWGLTDRHTWHSWRHPRADGEAPRPLPFDAELHPTRAWGVLVDRLSVGGSA